MNAQAQRVRPRRKTVLALVIVGSLAGFLAIFAIWANRQLLDTNNWVDTSTKLLENKEIRDQTAGYLADQLYASNVPQTELQQALPPRAKPLAAPLASGLREATERTFRILLERPRVQKLWEQANRNAHKTFLHIVEGGGPNVSTENGNVTLNLKALLGQGGISGTVASKLPPDAAQLTILRSDQLSTAQDLVDLLRVLAIGLVVVALALFALAIYLAEGWRREAFRACGIGLAAAGLLALIARSLSGSAVTNSLASTESVKPAISSAFGIGTSLLVEAAVAAIAYGVVIVVAAWLAGPTTSAVATRRSMAPYLREPAYAFGALALIVVLILWWGPTPATRKVIPMIVLTGLLAFGTEVLRRQTAREFPNATREEAARRRRAAWNRWRSSSGEPSQPDA